MGRTIDITQAEDTPVTRVQFTDSDGDTFWIQRDHRTLCLENANTLIRFLPEDLDNMIKLFQAAKQYKI